MKITKQSWMIMGLTVPVEIRGDILDIPNPINETELADESLRLLEHAGRLCYKTEGMMGDMEKSRAFIRDKIKRGHHSLIEHVSIVAKAITDRGVTHELVRHRIASYSQESTRYCNYSKDKYGNEIEVILPVEFYEVYDNRFPDGRNITGAEIVSFGVTELKENPALRTFYEWAKGCLSAEKHYMSMINVGAAAQLARSVLPNSTKTEIVFTFNVREWRHFFTLRNHAAAHPQMRQLANSIHTEFVKHFPVFFDDIPLTEY